jgi:signal transduction histidine kinase
MTMNLFIHVIDGLAQITVSDTGSGIDTEFMPRLFQKFVTKPEKGQDLDYSYQTG